MPGHCYRNGHVVTAMVTLWMLVIQEQDPICRAGAIINDRDVRTDTCELKSVLTESASFDELSGHSMHTIKTVVFSTSIKGRTQLFFESGVPFKQSHVVKILGAAAQRCQSNVQRSGQCGGSWLAWHWDASQRCRSLKTMSNV